MHIAHCALAGLLLTVATPVSAQAPTHQNLRASAIRAVNNVDWTETRPLKASTAQASAPQRSWIKRHPVLFGALVGAAVGTGVVGATTHSEAAFVGFYGGGAAGALIGWTVSR